ncbi:flavin oxidoreductase [Rhodonellum psychrophilum GCM71 = DSM 17998]|uniref:Flavin oxidoreductase n=2 Tax=Rhodonellum TaxID=336827 RepID=U5C858_9BACT|nr:MULTISPECIES: flavin reductase [Rhodonellum]ERM84357.1 flavin oxidoreductase [Rhodonellum psychrophilum GCM71 = DSM 17998]SDZ42742.1 NADH-FMN oxidoreductase RutF, flavin reductase (DIM6/NTAB) family [Rhodonellum ikkaensis]
MIKHFDKQSILEADPSFRRNFVNCLSGYKSLNLIGTKNNAGVSNLSPFSQVFHIGASPPLVGILFRPHTVVRHTLENILETGFFTLNHVTKDFYKEAHQTAANYEGSEFEATGLKEEYLSGFHAPFVEMSPMKIACSYSEHQTLKINGTVLIIGAIEHVFVKEEGIKADGFLDLDFLGTVTVSGLDEYHLGKKLSRLSYPKPGKGLTEI